MPAVSLLLCLFPWCAPQGAPVDAAATPARRAEVALVALLETPAPQLASFHLRATVPVRRGTFPTADGRVPFVVRDWTGRLLPTQVDVVSRYPRWSDGADVVEVSAVATRPADAVPGVPLFYAVVRRPAAGAPPAGAPFPAGVPADVLGLLADPDSIRVRSRDCFGNVYVHRPLAAQHVAPLVAGPLRNLVRTHGAQLPEPEVAGPSGTLPHLLGVHAYLSTHRAEARVGLDLRLHNAHSGNDPATSEDDPLGTVYFDSVELVVPAGWTLLQDFDDPSFADPWHEGDRRVYPLVKPLADGALHVMRWQAQFHRRLVLVPDAHATLGRQYADGAGRAFVRRAAEPGTGRALDSWWNVETARYYPTNQQLPDLDHVGRPALKSALVNELSALAELVRTGQGLGVYPLPASRLGWGHPLGVAYGGMTGGQEVFLFAGVRTAASACLSGVRLAALRHRMHTDRQPHALFDLDGEPARVEDWVIENGDQDWVPFTFYQRPVLSAGDPFGVGGSPAFQRDHVAATGRAPWYETAHFAFDPHDQEHVVRYTHSPKTLVWLANDALAKDDLRMTAETFHLSYHGYCTGPWGEVQSNGLLAHRAYVDAHPGKGLAVGRGEGWGVDATCAAYAFADKTWRDAKRPWLDRVVDNFVEAQHPCTGFLQAASGGHFFNWAYRGRQQIEQTILENAMRGLITTVYGTADAARSLQLLAVLEESLRAFVSAMSWFPGHPSPWTKTALGPLPVDQGNWCDQAQIPPDGVVPEYESYQNWSCLGWGYEHTGDPLFLEKALLQSGGGDLYANLLAAGAENVENKAALLALAQRLHGDL